MTTAVLPTTGEASDLDALDTLAPAPEGGSSSTELEPAPEIIDADLVDDIVLPQATATWTPPPVFALWVEPSALVDNPASTSTSRTASFSAPAGSVADRAPQCGSGVLAGDVRRRRSAVAHAPSREMAAAIPGARLMILPGVGHVPPRTPGRRSPAR